MSIFAIFTIFVLIFIIVSIDRILHIMIVFNIEKLFINLIFLFFQNQIFEICHFFRRKPSCVRIVESIFLNFFFKKLRNDFLTSFFSDVIVTHEKNLTIFDIFSKIQTIEFSILRHTKLFHLQI